MEETISQLFSDSLEMQITPPFKGPSHFLPKENPSFSKVGTAPSMLNMQAANIHRNDSLRSRFKWSPGCTNTNENNLFPPVADWPEYLKCTNGGHLFNFLHLQKTQSTTASELLSETLLEEEMIISTSAASIPAIQTNQRALPRIVRRTSAFDLAPSTHPLPSESLATTATFVSASPPKEPFFSSMLGLKEHNLNITPPQVPSLNLLFANKHPNHQMMMDSYPTSWGSLVSPKSPELDPGGHLSVGTLRHCLSPDSLTIHPLLGDVDLDFVVDDGRRFHFTGGDDDDAETGMGSYVTEPKGSSSHSRARDAVAAAWSSLLEGTIIGDTPQPPPSSSPCFTMCKKNQQEDVKFSPFSSFDALKRHPLSMIQPPLPTMTGTKKPTAPLLPADKFLLVSFKNGRSEIFLRPEGQEDTSPLTLLDYVVVEGDRGEDLGVISGAVGQPWAHAIIRRWNDSTTGSSSVRFALSDEECCSGGEIFAPWSTIVSMTTTISTSLPKSNDDHHQQQPANATGGGLYFTNLKDLMAKRRILRVAMPEEIKSWRSQRQEESLAVLRCAAVVRSHRLPMTIVDAEYQHDRAKLTFYYISSSGRVDFREMVRDLFRIYKARIWMCSVGPDCTAPMAEELNP